MKAILISIKPQWVSKILNGEKTIEIRKTCPAVFKNLKPYEGASLDVYIYCTKTKYVNYVAHLEGKVVAKFTLNKVETIEYLADDYCTETYRQKELTRRCCLTDMELHNYLKHNIGYAWHISNLVIFDRPRELGEFKRNEEYVNCNKCPYFNVCEKTDYIEVRNGICYIPVPLTKAPQNWCYIESED